MHEVGISTRDGRAPRSPFVTAIGWIFIVFAVYSLFSSLFVLLVPVFAQSSLLFSRLFEELEIDGIAADYFKFFLGASPPMQILSLFVAIVEMVAGVAVLRRLNWGRILVIGVLSYYILLSLPFLVFGAVLLIQAASSIGAQQRLALMLIGFFLGFIVLAFDALYAWIVWRFASPKYRQEFA